MDDKQNQENQSFFNAEILQQAGIGPIEMPIPPKKSKKSLVIVVSALVGLLVFGGGLAVFLLTGKSTDNTNKEVVLVANKETVETILDLAATNDFAAVKSQYVSSLSPLAAGKTDEGLVSPHVGDDINWALCSRPTSDVAPTARHKETDGKIYDVAYVTADCKTESGTTKKIELDIRRPEGTTDNWKLYFLVLRSKTDV